MCHFGRQSAPSRKLMLAARGTHDSEAGFGTGIGGDFYDRRNKSKLVSRMVSRLGKLGYQVTLTPTEPSELASDKPSSEPTSQISLESEFHADLVGEEPTPVPTAPASVSSEFTVEISAPDITLVRRRKRGRPCKCAERGIPCKHQVGLRLNSFETQGVERGKFS